MCIVAIASSDHFGVNSDSVGINIMRSVSIRRDAANGTQKITAVLCARPRCWRRRRRQQRLM